MRFRGIPLSGLPRLVSLRPNRFERPLHVFLCVCDHFEPAWQRPARHVEEARVARWLNDFPKLAQDFRDSSGQHPQHTFFYPIEDAEYDDGHIAKIAELCRRGFGDIEVHLHHHDDSSDQLRELIERRIGRLHDEHGLLAKDALGRITYGFIHGNWALDNSRPDGKWCGVNDELTILRETGCYADFTMPSAPDACQTTTLNSIYYALDDPHRPKSHDRGTPARVGQVPPREALLMIQGPLAFDWGNRKWGLAPRLENGDLTGRNPPSMRRFALWCGAGVRVAGREDRLFVKLHTHGAQEANLEMLLGEPMRRFHAELRDLAAAHSGFTYRYVTAREMAILVHETEREAGLAPTVDSSRAIVSD